MPRPEIKLNIMPLKPRYERDLELLKREILKKRNGNNHDKTVRWLTR